MKHIELAFDDIAAQYDQQRRDLIPCFDDFYNTIINLIDSPIKDLRILDIGAGTGLLSWFALQRYPKSHITLIDISEDMLNVAKKRFEGYGNISYIKADYSNYAFAENYDAVISSLSIHHLNDEEKGKLYKTIYNILNNDGRFINGDLFLSRCSSLDTYFHELWVRKIEASALNPKEKEGAYSRMKLDQPSTLDATYVLLEKAGFKVVDLIYRYYNFGVVIAKK
jgi:tRNA (cmo5U34)-methyltransferase